VQRAACRQSVTTPAPNVPILYWQFPYPDQNPSQHQQDYELVQRDAANFNVRNSIATVIPAVVIFILLGSNSDIIGRRPLLVLPFFGKIVRYVFMLIIVSRDLSDTWLIATHALEAVFGSDGLVMLSALAYITDCTNESRTRAFFVTEVMTFIARIIPVLALSIWLRYHLYTVPLSVDLTLSVIGLFYALLVQPESVESV
jgi:MFS family permease